MKKKAFRMIAIALALACLCGCTARLEAIGADFADAVATGRYDQNEGAGHNQQVGSSNSGSVNINPVELGSDGSYDPQQIFRMCSPGVVWVQTQFGGGTGFFIEEDVIVTNNHVISGASWANVQTANGSIYAVMEVIARSDDPDLALLRIDGSGMPLEPNSHGVTVGEAVYTIGAPMGIFPTLSDGIVMNNSYVEWDTNYILTNVHTIGGSSGGPLFNRYGEVMGVVVGGMSDGPNAIDLVISIDHIHDLDRSSPQPIESMAEHNAAMNIPDEENYSIVPLADAQVGDLVRLGHYEQDNDMNNGAEDILWLVLERNGDELKLLSLYCLDTMPYHTRPGDVTWETSSIRAYLNGDFYTQAFSEEERALILTCNVLNDDNPNHGTPGGYDTWDKVYLLSLDEVVHYWDLRYEETVYDDLYAQATEYCMTRPIWLEIEGSSRCWWWLRSPGGAPDMAAEVGSMGYLSFNGSPAEVPERAIRPVIHVTAG